MNKNECRVSIEDIYNHLGASRDIVKRWSERKICQYIGLIENGNLKLVKLVNGRTGRIV